MNATPISPEAPTSQAGSPFCVSVDEALSAGAPDRISDVELQHVLSAAVRLYGAKCEERGSEFSPFGGRPVTATEAITAICAIMREADLNFFDVQMWFSRGQKD